MRVLSRGVRRNLTYGRPRIATLDDLDILVEHRRAMFAEMGTPQDARSEAIPANTRSWLHAQIESGAAACFLIDAKNEARPVAGGAVTILSWPPTHLDPLPLRGYVFNVYVDRAHRHRGLAKAVTSACVEHCRARGIRVVALHAADDARALYKTLGFRETSELLIEL